MYCIISKYLIFFILICIGIKTFFLHILTEKLQKDEYDR